MERRTTLPDDVRVHGSHSVTIDEPGEDRITFHPATVDLCQEAIERLKRAIPFESEKPPNAPATRRAPNHWHRRREGRQASSQCRAVLLLIPVHADHRFRHADHPELIEQERWRTCSPRQRHNSAG